MIRRRIVMLAACATIALSAGWLQAATITIVNLDAAGEGFNDPTAVAPVGGNPGVTVGQQRLNVFNQAASLWGAVLPSSVPVLVGARFDPLSCGATSGVLGSAGPMTVHANFPGAEVTGHWYHQALANKQRSTDNSANHDIQATFNANVGTAGCLQSTFWYYGLDHSEGGGLDLLAVVLHELGHGLGFSTTTNPSTGAYTGALPGIWDRFLQDRVSGLHWNQMTAGQRQASAISTGNLVWDGPAVTFMAPLVVSAGTSPEGRMRMYAPNPVQPGSSGSHFDVTATPSLLMEPLITSGLTDDLDLTRYLLEDIGWLPRTTAVGPAVARPAGVAMRSAPNPFRATTTLRLDLATGGMVELVVLDLGGRSVRKLVRSWLPPGAHVVAWDGADDDGRPVSSGVYLTRVRHGATRLTQRIVRVN